jgi:hypothetical protein
MIHALVVIGVVCAGLNPVMDNLAQTFPKGGVINALAAATDLVCFIPKAVSLGPIAAIMSNPQGLGTFINNSVTAADDLEHHRYAKYRKDARSSSNRQTFQVGQALPGSTGIPTSLSKLFDASPSCAASSYRLYGRQQIMVISNACERPTRGLHGGGSIPHCRVMARE